MKTVYTCFCTDVIHAGHLNIIEEAHKYGKVVVGCLSDEALIRYNRFPTISQDERIKLYQSLDGVEEVVVQNDMLYDDVIKMVKPYPFILYAALFILILGAIIGMISSIRPRLRSDFRDTLYL